MAPGRGIREDQGELRYLWRAVDREKLNQPLRDALQICHSATLLNNFKDLGRPEIISAPDAIMRSVQTDLNKLIELRRKIITRLGSSDGRPQQLNEQLADRTTEIKTAWNFPFSSEVTTTTLWCTPENLLQASRRLSPECEYRASCLEFLDRIRAIQATEADDR